MNKLIILVGNIGTGKSTYAKKLWKDKLVDVIIARDQLRYNIGLGNYIFNYDYEPIIWKTELFMFENFINLGVNILVDEVGISKKIRERYIPYAKVHHYQIEVIEMPRLSMKEAVDRRMQDPHGQLDRKLWESVWTKFNNQYESPSKEEGIDRIIKL